MAKRVDVPVVLQQQVPWPTLLAQLGRQLIRVLRQPGCFMAEFHTISR